MFDGLTATQSNFSWLSEEHSLSSWDAPDPLNIELVGQNKNVFSHSSGIILGQSSTYQQIQSHYQSPIPVFTMKPQDLLTCCPKNNLQPIRQKDTSDQNPQYLRQKPEKGTQHEPEWYVSLHNSNMR